MLTQKSQESLLANMQERLIQTDQGTLILGKPKQEQRQQQQQNTATNAGKAPFMTDSSFRSTRTFIQALEFSTNTCVKSKPKRF